MLAGILKMWCFPKKLCVFCQVTRDNPNFDVVFEVRFQIFVEGGHVLPRLLGMFVVLLLTNYTPLER